MDGRLHETESIGMKSYCFLRRGTKATSPIGQKYAKCSQDYYFFCGRKRTTSPLEIYNETPFDELDSIGVKLLRHAEIPTKLRKQLR